MTMETSRPKPPGQDHCQGLLGERKNDKVIRGSTLNNKNGVSTANGGIKNVTLQDEETEGIAIEGKV